MLSPLLFQPIFILGLFFVAVVQCLTMLMTSMVISPNGKSGKCSTWIQVRSLFPPQDRVLFWLFLFPFFLYCALILFLKNALSSFYFSNPYLSTDFSLLLCGAVFLSAVDFNGDLSKWQVGEVTTMQQSTYNLSPLPLQDRVFFWLLLFPLLLSVAALILFLNNALCSFYFQTHFYLWTFLCCCVVQCFGMLMPSMVISPPGRSGKWRPCNSVSTLFPPPSLQDRVFF